MSESKKIVEKKLVTDVFIDGAKKGWEIAINSTLPNLIMAFVIIYALSLTGALDLLAFIFKPVMAVFGLPGEAMVVLLTTVLSMGGGVGAAVTLFASGSLSVENIAVMAPAMYLMGAKIQYLGRILGVVGINMKYLPIMLLISVINAFISIWIMNLLVL
ncbi:SpmB family inner membrane protein [Gammaproteobacteria bacterium]|nr:SpmB family inner membrane protein [Gammaproteobacteria bacterium]